MKTCVKCKHLTDKRYCLCKSVQIDNMGIEIDCIYFETRVTPPAHFDYNERNYTEGFKIIEGIGKDAPIETNERGGKQSKSPAALHLIDPDFLEAMSWPLDRKLTEDTTTHKCLVEICNYMRQFEADYDDCFLHSALDKLEKNSLIQLIIIGKVLQEGAKKYPVGNWRLIPREQHINHALIHLVAILAKDTQDDHLEHAICRLMMAIATKETEGFSYTGTPTTKED